MPAALLKVDELRPVVLAFGIVTPPAIEGATLKKDSTPNAGTVMDGKPHDVIHHTPALGPDEHIYILSDAKIPFIWPETHTQALC